MVTPMPEDRLDRSLSRSFHTAKPRSLDAGPVVNACITAGTSFATKPPTDSSVWLDQLGTIVAHHLSSIALELLSANESKEHAHDRGLVSKLRAGGGTTP